MISSHKPNAKLIATLTPEVLAALTADDLGIKGYKRYPGGDEAEIFAAELTFKGVPVASLYEAGRGGELEIEWYRRDLEAPVRRIVDALPEEDATFLGKTHTFRLGVADYLGDLAEKEGERADIIRRCKTNTVFRLPGDGASFRTIKGLYTIEERKYLIEKFGATVEILNETVAGQKVDGADAQALVDAAEKARMVKQCKTGVWIRLATGEWRGWKVAPYTKQLQAVIDSKYPGAFVANKEWAGQTAI